MVLTGTLRNWNPRPALWHRFQFSTQYPKCVAHIYDRKPSGWTDLKTLLGGFCRDIFTVAEHLVCLWYQLFLVIKVRDKKRVSRI